MDGVSQHGTPVDVSLSLVSSFWFPLKMQMYTTDIAFHFIFA